MPHELTLSIEPVGAGDDASERVLGLLEEYNRQHHARGEHHFIATLRGSDGSIEGGITARCFWGWLYIVALAIQPSWRGHGYGRRLLGAAEAWAVDCGCRHAWLMTMSFQSKGFYERAGYSVFAELPDFPGSEIRFFMRKDLQSHRARSG